MAANSTVTSDVNYWFHRLTGEIKFITPNE